MKPLGILGGTFDPIHFGHLRLAQELATGLGLGEVCFIPSGRPPHRAEPDVPAAHRLEMVRLGVFGNPLFTLDPREIHKPDPSYTVETLAELRRDLGPKQPLCLLMGTDAFLGLATWHRWQELFGLAHIAVAQRPGVSSLTRAAATMPVELRDALNHRLTHEPEALHSAPAGAIIVQAITALDISATRIREQVRSGESPRYLLPGAVLDYIETHRLYENPDPARVQGE